jgi:hypothetical protein
MQIFVAYGYNDRDRWIEKQVFPLVEAFNSRVIHGKDIRGQALSKEIQGRIQRSHALVAFVTRRDVGAQVSVLDSNRLFGLSAPAAGA